MRYVHVVFLSNVLYLRFHSIQIFVYSEYWNEGMNSVICCLFYYDSTPVAN